MKKPTLIIMAAGMGSRYGGLKQIDPIDEYGNVIIDYSLYDAKRAGFENVIFIIKEENRKDFDEIVINKIKDKFNIEIAIQDINNLPPGFSVPEGRIKPWGTAHAVYSCKDIVDGPVAIINADDYYGVHAFKKIYDFLSTKQDSEKFSYTMVGYLLKNTVTENGHVARGVCEVKDSKLVGITERTKIECHGDKIEFTEDDSTWTELPKECVVSMNMWGFSKSIVKEIVERFPDFLNDNLTSNPLKCEYFLPYVVNCLLAENKAEVTVLTSSDKWYGVTYKDDKPVVMDAIKRMKAESLYPEKLWD